MAKQQKPKMVRYQRRTIDDMFVNYSAVCQVGDGKAGMLGALLLSFGDRYIEVLVSEEGAQGIIEQLEKFLDGEAPKAFE